jgi:hypothetical protein
MTHEFISFVQKTMVKYKVTLTQNERGELMPITKGGTHTSQKGDSFIDFIEL